MNSNNMPYNKQLISDILDEYMDDLVSVSYVIHTTIGSVADKLIVIELEYDPRNIPTDPLFTDLVVTYKKYCKNSKNLNKQNVSKKDIVKGDLIKKINGYGVFNRISKITSYELDDFNHHFPNSIVLRLDKEY